MNIEYKILKRKEINNLIRKRRSNSGRCNNMLFHGTNYQSLTASPIEIKKMFEVCKYIQNIVDQFLKSNSDAPFIKNKTNKQFDCVIENKVNRDYGDVFVTDNLYNAILYCTNSFGELGKSTGNVIEFLKKQNIDLNDDRFNKYLFYFKNHIYRYHKAEKAIIIFQNVAFVDMKVASNKSYIEISKVKPIDGQLVIDALKLEQDDDPKVVGKVILEKDFDLLIDVIANNEEKKLLKDKYQL